MVYKWIEKGTRFNKKDYHFSLSYDEITDCVLLTCEYGNYSTRLLFTPDEERFIYESLDEVKELLYRHSYI